MSKYLIKTTEVYRCDSEQEANELIKEAKTNGLYTVSKSSSEIRTTKQKGEIIDEWRRVTLTKSFNDEKEPYGKIYVSYDTTRGEVVDENQEIE